MQHVFLTVLESRKSKAKLLADSVSGGKLLGSYRAVYLLCPHKVEGARELSGAVL